MTAIKDVPNSTNAECCPDFPQTCLCPISPPHEPLPVHLSPCGHCDARKVAVPVLLPKIAEEMIRTDIILAGGGYCPRCQRTLCTTCEDRNPDQKNYDCAGRQSKD